MKNRHLFIYLLFILFLYADTSSLKSNITEGQKKEIEALTKDMFLAPDFKLNSVDGKKYRISDLRGKVIILNFWATWCGPCRMEIPDFNELYLSNKDRGLVILGISTDDTRVGLLNFLKSYTMEYPVLYGSARQISKISNDYGGIMALPTSIIIDRKGEIKRIYPTAILKNYTPQIYSSFLYDVETALGNKNILQEETK